MCQRSRIDQPDMVRVGSRIVQSIERRAGERTVLPRVIFK
jgi:hypothetical protein